jgi:hypothetical protein
VLKTLTSHFKNRNSKDDYSSAGGVSAVRKKK